MGSEGIPKWVIPTAIGGTVVLFIIILLSWGVGVSNSEVRLRRTIEAKLTDNESEFDNMFKKIAQVAQISEKQKSAIIDLVTGHAEARGGIKGGGFVNMLQESIPNQTMDQYQKLSTVVVASRDRWTMRQKELIDLKREHDTLRTIFPSSMVVGGRPTIEIAIVTSTKAKRAMETGVDDDVNLFNE